MAYVAYAQDENSEYADVLVDAFYKPWSPRDTSFYGGHATRAVRGKNMDPRAILGNNNYYISLPIGSWVIVQFTDNMVVDVPGQDDLFIEELGMAGDRAEVLVSEDGVDFLPLGRANGGVTNSIDLADANYTGVVNYVKIIGLDRRGSSPGFDVIKIYGLPNSNIDLYIPEDSLRNYLTVPNHYNQRFLLKPVEFELDSYELREKGRAYLDSLADLIVEFPDIQLQIVGHTDDLGTDEYNDNLSLRRARSVYNHLVEGGVDASSLTYEGLGAREPLTSNKREEGKRRNRRVELIKVD